VLRVQSVPNCRDIHPIQALDSLQVLVALLEKGKLSCSSWFFVLFLWNPLAISFCGVVRILLDLHLRRWARSLRSSRIRSKGSARVRLCWWFSFFRSTQIGPLSVHKEEVLRGCRIPFRRGLASWQNKQEKAHLLPNSNEEKVNGSDDPDRFD